MTHDVRISDHVCGAMGINPLEPAVGEFTSYVVTPGDLTLTLPPAIGFANHARVSPSMRYREVSLDP